MPILKLKVGRPTPFHQMDDQTKAKLDQIRLYTPRYLFRAWRDSNRTISGGYKTLNTPDAIIPLAFRMGRDHSSVYDMSKEELTSMVLKHLAHETVDFFTEFASFTASLAFALRFFGEQNDDVYISIVDTHALKPHNEIFFVPDLDFLEPGVMKGMHHEYLAHGPVRGVAHSAIPLKNFLLAGFDPRCLPPPGVKTTSGRPNTITAPAVWQARAVGEDYGYSFAIPITLALICVEKRNPRHWMREGDAGMETILEELDVLRVVQKWSCDDTIMEDLVYTKNYMDVRQLILLMRAVVRHQIIKSAKGKAAREILESHTTGEAGRQDMSGKDGVWQG